MEEVDFDECHRSLRRLFVYGPHYVKVRESEETKESQDCYKCGSAAADSCAESVLDKVGAAVDDQFIMASERRSFWRRWPFCFDYYFPVEMCGHRGHRGHRDTTVPYSVTYIYI